VVAAEVEHLDLAYDYLGETAFIDLRDLAFNTRDGLHLASLAGAWLVVVAGFGGLRDTADRLSFDPRLPSRLARISFRLVYRGRRLRVDVDATEVRYELQDGDPLEILHHDEAITLRRDQPQGRPATQLPRRPAPPQPPARPIPRRHRDA